MVFTSIPAAYLDAANWQQQQQPNHQPGNNNSTSQQHLLPPPPPPPLPPHGAGGSAGSIRPGSMTDRARMANVPIPETAMKCPRCESTNTKFCYFNNYSLSQPRHFCKTCRRYWTRGGALRNVPVGGGCRRNKRSKGGSSSGSAGKSPASSDRQTGSACSTNSVSSNTVSSAADMLGLGPQIPPMRFMAPLHHQFSEFGGGGGGGDMGLNYGLSYNPISGPIGGVSDLSFQIGNAFGGGGGGNNGGGGGGGGGGCGSILSGIGLDHQWRSVPQTQQFPFLAGLEGSPTGLYHHPFEGSVHHQEITGYGVSNLRPKVSTSGLMTQLASVKMEDSRELNLSSQFLGSNINNNNNPASDQQYWSTTTAGTNSAAWTDISGFSSSSTTSNQM